MPQIGDRVVYYDPTLKVEPSPNRLRPAPDGAQPVWAWITAVHADGVCDLKQHGFERVGDDGAYIHEPPPMLLLPSIKKQAGDVYAGTWAIWPSDVPSSCYPPAYPNP